MGESDVYDGRRAGGIVAVRRRTVNPGDYPKYIRGRVEIPAGFTSIEDDGDLDWVYWWSRSLRYYYSSHN